jgi:hypothetical protein
MKASHNTLIKLAELGILKSLQSFLTEPLKPGRLRTKLQAIDFFVSNQLDLIYARNPNIFIQNKEEIAAYLEKFNLIMHKNILERKDIHIVSVVLFCISFLKETKTQYPKELVENLNDIVDYYTRQDNIIYVNFMMGRNFTEEWEKLNG